MNDSNDNEQDPFAPFWEVRFTDKAGEAGYFDVQANDRAAAQRQASQGLGAGETLLEVTARPCFACDGSGIDRRLPDEAPCEQCEGAGLEWSELLEDQL